MTTTNTASISSLRDHAQAPREAALPTVSPGFGSLQSFELMQRAAKLLTASDLVPSQYRAVIEKKNYKGEVTSSIENPRALANAGVALNMAHRMGADPLMVMQNLYVVEGRPSWSSQWIIAAINACGRFSPLRFDIVDKGEKTTECVTYEWANGDRQRKVTQVKHQDKTCVAWALEIATGERLNGPTVSIEMAVREGWYSKNGSKWQTMDEVMLRYRAASFFGKLYAPELLMGLQTTEEAQDIIELQPQRDGSFAANLEELRAGPAAATPAEEKPAAETAPAPADEKTGAGQGDGAAQPDAPGVDELFPPAADKPFANQRRPRAPISAE